MKNKNNAILNCNNLEELLEVEYGKKGTAQRDKFDKETETFCLAQTLREERKLAGLTQQQLADAVDVSRQTINAIESGKFVPSTVLALKIARTFEKQVEEIFSLEEED